MLELRCSQLPLFMQCASSARPGGTDRGTSAPAELGTQVHSALACTIAGAVGVPHNDEVEKLYQRGLRTWELLKDSIVAPQCEYALETVIGPTWALTGHVDVLGVGENNTISFLDFKSGWGLYDYTEQMRGYALMIVTQFDKDCVGLIVPLRYWTADMIHDAQLFERSKVSWMRNRITGQVAKVGEEYAPSRICAWCKHRDGCEAFRDAEVTALALVRQERNDLATLADVLVLHEQVKMVENAAGAARDWIRRFVEEFGPIPAPNGKELARTPIVKKTIDAQRGWPVMAEMLTEKELAGVVTVHKGMLEKAIKKLVGRGEKAKAWAKMRMRLTEVGAMIEADPTYQVRMRKRRETRDA